MSFVRRCAFIPSFIHSIIPNVFSCLLINIYMFLFVCDTTLVFLLCICNFLSEYMVNKYYITYILLLFQDLTITISSERPDTEIDIIPDENEMSGINVQTFVDQQVRLNTDLSI